MNPREPWILAGTALLLFAFIMLVERQGERRALPESSTAPLLADFIPARITSLELRRTNLIVRVERVHDRWRLNAPGYPARNNEIDQLLEAVSRLPRASLISAREYLEQPGGLAAYGLEQPLATLVFEDGSRKTALAVGATTLIGEQVYLQVDGAAEIVVSDAAWLDLLPASARDWRSPRLVHQDSFEFDAMTLLGSAGAFHAERESPRRWRITRPMRARADFRRIEELSQLLRMARVMEFVSDDPKALEVHGLNNPRASISLLKGMDPVFQIDFGQTNASGQVYARLLSHNNTVLVARELLDEAQKPYTWFRDRALIGFDPSEIRRVEWSNPARTVLDRGENGAWRILEPYQAPADAELIEQFLHNLLQVEIVEFTKDVVTDFSGYGLTAPARSYSLYHRPASNQTNTLLAQIDLSSNRFSGVDRVFARRSDENSVYTVGFGDVLRLADHPYTLRDRRIWNFASSEVTRIAISQRGQSHSLTRAGGWTEDDIANAAIEETLHRLGALRAVEWIARGEDRLPFYGFPEVDFSLSIELDRAGRQETRFIRFGTLSRGGHPFAAVRLEEELVLFTFPAGLFELVARELTLPVPPP